MNKNDFLQKIFDMLALDEGIERRPYDDSTGKAVKAPVGNLTIGVGRNLDAKPLSNSIILAILKEDVNDAIQDVKAIIGERVWELLSDNRKMALINLAFSLGERGLRKFQRMLTAIIENDFKKAGDELQQSLWAKQVDRRNSPLEGRDYRVIRLLRDDIYEY